MVVEESLPPPLPRTGIYIYMSVHVIRLLLLFFLVYSTTLLAFALAFHLLLPSNPNFDNPVTSLLKVGVTKVDG